MATTKFKNGDRFRFSTGFGVIVSAKQAVVITGGGREGWKVEKTDIPADIYPLHDHKTVPMEVQMAMNGVIAAIG